MTKTRTLLNIYDTGIHIPASVISGGDSKRVITISAGVHSREYIGIQALTELAEELDPENINGKVVILHCCNYDGFIQRSNDVFPQDGKNLNRVFPGNISGSVTDKAAAYLKETVIKDSDCIVDLHSGGFCEELIPHVYFQTNVGRGSEEMARLTSVPYIVHSTAKNGFYSWACHKGVPSIILERGGCGLVNKDEVKEDKNDVKNILRGLGFLHDGIDVTRHPQTLITKAYYEDAPCSGCWHPLKKAGDRISKDELLGRICDIYGDTIVNVHAKEAGVILYQTISLGIEEGTSMIAYGAAGES